MRKNTRHLVHAAIIAALYVVLTHLQNLLIPGSASFAIQFRASEALCVLAFFTPAAIPGLTLGTLLFNISTSALPCWAAWHPLAPPFPCASAGTSPSKAIPF